MMHLRLPQRIGSGLMLILLLIASSIGCVLSPATPTPAPSETPSPTPSIAVRPTETPSKTPSLEPSPTLVPTTKVTPTRWVDPPTATPTDVPPTDTPTPEGGGGPPVGVNFLKNPGFEAPFLQYLGRVEFNVADGWVPWYLESGFAPEYKPAEPPYYSRIHGGERAQQYFKTHGTYTAGLYQQVPMEPGTELRFSIWGQAWSHDGSGDCPADQSCNPAAMGMRIGIDPYGDPFPTGDNVIWSSVQSPTDGWALFTVEAVSEGDIVTVFTWSSPNQPRRNQDTYWDDATLEVVP